MRTLVILLLLVFAPSLVFAHEPTPKRCKNQNLIKKKVRKAAKSRFDGLSLKYVGECHCLHFGPHCKERVVRIPAQSRYDAKADIQYELSLSARFKKKAKQIWFYPVSDTKDLQDVGHRIRNQPAVRDLLGKGRLYCHLKSGPLAKETIVRCGSTGPLTQNQTTRDPAAGETVVEVEFDASRNGSVRVVSAAAKAMAPGHHEAFDTYRKKPAFIAFRDRFPEAWSLSRARGVRLKAGKFWLQGFMHAGGRIDYRVPADLLDDTFPGWNVHSKEPEVVAFLDKHGATNVVVTAKNANVHLTTKDGHSIRK